MFKIIWSMLTGSTQKSPTAPEDSDIEKHRQIIRAYGNYIQAEPIDGTEIRDVSALPHPKKNILDALKSVILHENNDQLIEIMIASGILLANFQKDIGPRPISVLGDIRISEMQEAVMENDGNLTKSLQQRIANNPFKDKYVSLLPVVDQEQAKIKKDLDAAKILSNAIHSAIK